MFAVGILALVLTGGVIWLTYTQVQTLIHPPRLIVAQTPDDVGITDWQDVTFESTDGLTLQGWFIPPDERGITLILVHGLAANRGAMLDHAALLHEQGYGLLLFDLRNHGASDGDSTTLGYVESGDVVKAFEVARTLPGVDPERIGLLGESMGGAAVILAAKHLPEAKAFVVESTFTTLEDNVADSIRNDFHLPAYPLTLLHLAFTSQAGGFPARELRPIDAVGAISPRPLLILHGDNDPLFPPFNPERLYAAAGDPKRLVIMPMNGHGGLIRHAPEAYAATLLPFLDEHLG